MTSFHTRGWAFVPKMMDPALAAEIGRDAQARALPSVAWPDVPGHRIVAAGDLRAKLPALTAQVSLIVQKVRLVTAQDVFFNPSHPAYAGPYVQVYDPPSWMPWHQDVSPVSCIVYLSTNTEGPTSLIDLRGQRHDVYPVAGAALVYLGQRLSHQGGKLETETKVIAGFTLDVAGSGWHPARTAEAGRGSAWNS